jgi:hypothetical protein
MSIALYDGSAGLGHTHQRAASLLSPVDCATALSAYLSVRLPAGRPIHIEGSADGGATWHLVPVTRLSTGTVGARIDGDGVYVCDVSAFVLLRRVEDWPHHNGGYSVTCRLSPYPAPAVPRRLPDPLPVYPVQTAGHSVTMREVPSGRRVMSHDPDSSRLYLGGSGAVYATDDYGQTITQLTGLGSYPAKMPSSGALVVIGSDGRIHRAPSDDGPWVEVYDCRDDGHDPSPWSQAGHIGWGGISVHGTTVLWAPYQNPKLAIDIYVYASFDDAVTWQVIRKSPDSKSSAEAQIDASDGGTTTSGDFAYHWHDVALDPYLGRIWTVSGDGQAVNCSYTDDLGATWVEVEGQPQHTCIQPMPTGVTLFGTDVPSHNGVWRYVHHADGSPSASSEAHSAMSELAFAASRADAVTGKIVMGRGGHMWQTGGVCYMSCPDPACVVATRDGQRFWVVARMPVDIGGGTVWGGRADGMLAGYGRAGDTRYLWSCRAPVWSDA